MVKDATAAELDQSMTRDHSFGTRQGKTLVLP